MYQYTAYRITTVFLWLPTAHPLFSDHLSITFRIQSDGYKRRREPRQEDYVPGAERPRADQTYRMIFWSTKIAFSISNIKAMRTRSNKVVGILKRFQKIGCAASSRPQ